MKTSAVRRIQESQKMHQRGLPGPGRPHDRDEFSLFYRKRNILEGPDLHFTDLVSFGDVFCFEKLHGDFCELFFFEVLGGPRRFADFSFSFFRLITISDPSFKPSTISVL